MNKSNTNTEVMLDTVEATAYLKSIGFPNDFQDEESIKKAFVLCSRKYLSQKLSTLLFCSIVNKMIYNDVIKYMLQIKDVEFESLLTELAELQYYELIHDPGKVDGCKNSIRKYLLTQKNRE